MRIGKGENYMTTSNEKAVASLLSILKTTKMGESVML